MLLSVNTNEGGHYITWLDWCQCMCPLIYSNRILSPQIFFRCYCQPLLEMSGGTSRSSGSRGSSQPHVNPKLHPPATAVHVALTPLDVLQNYELPLAVHLKTPTPSPRGVDTKKPILLYKNCDSVKVWKLSYQVL